MSRVVLTLGYLSTKVQNTQKLEGLLTFVERLDADADKLERRMRRYA